MDRISIDNNIDLHKEIHALMCQVFASMTKRLSGEKVKPEPQPVSQLPSAEDETTLSGGEVSVEASVCQ